MKTLLMLHPFGSRADFRRIAVLLSLLFCLVVIGVAVTSDAQTADPVGTWKVTFVRSDGTRLQGYAIFDGTTSRGKWLLTLKNGASWVFDNGNYKTSGTKVTLARGPQGLQGTGTFQTHSIIKGSLTWGAAKYTFTATAPQVTRN